MSPAELKLWNRIIRRASSLSPEMSSAVLRAFRTIRESMSESQLLEAIRTGTIDRIFTDILDKELLQQAFQPVRDTMRNNVIDAARLFSKDLPQTATASFAFDSLSPKVIDGIRQLETRVITTLEESVRETVRAYVENGLRDGDSPATIARSIKNIVGLSPTQEQAVRNYRNALEGNGKSPLSYKLRDKRYDPSVRKGEIAPERIDKMVEAYRKRAVAHNAETISRTATLDSMKLGQKLSVQDAVDKGVLDGTNLNKVWVGVMDNRERPEHVAMEGETVPYDSTFSNGENVPGESTYNCRCIARYVNA